MGRRGGLRAARRRRTRKRRVGADLVARVPDFIDMGDGWIWNVADLEIALGLSGGIVSVAVSALGVYAREKVARQRAARAARCASEHVRL